MLQQFPKRERAIAETGLARTVDQPVLIPCYNVIGEKQAVS